MGRRGKGLREMPTASASEGAAAPMMPNAQGVKLAPRFGPRLEDPKSQLLVGTVGEEHLPLEELCKMLLVSTIVEYHNVMMGELSVVQSEEVTCQLPRASVMELPPDDS